VAVKRVKLLWILPALAAVIVGIVFLRCVEDAADVEEPLRWRNAWEIPVNRIMSVDSAVYDEVQGILNNSIVDAVPDMDSSASNEFASIILDNDTLIRNIMGDSIPNLAEYLLNFMETDSSAKELLNRPEVKESLGDMSLDELAEVVADEIVSFKEETERFKNVPLPLGMESIPALNGLEVLSKIENPKIDYTLNLLNETPFNLIVYALFFEQEERWSDIAKMNDTVFLDFVKDHKYDGKSGYINLFDYTEKGERRTYLKIEARKPIKAPPLPEGMNDLLWKFIDGKSPVAWRWVAVIDGEIDEILSILGQREDYLIDVKLSIKVEGTYNLEEFFK
jgi:hypothetical protein